jgi:hypothetical protein
MREFRLYDSVRGALSDERPYRDSTTSWPRHDRPAASRGSFSKRMLTHAVSPSW